MYSWGHSICLCVALLRFKQNSEIEEKNQHLLDLYLENTPKLGRKETARKWGDVVRTKLAEFWHLLETPILDKMASNSHKPFCFFFYQTAIVQLTTLFSGRFWTVLALNSRAREEIVWATHTSPISWFAGDVCFEVMINVSQRPLPSSVPLLHMDYLSLRRCVYSDSIFRCNTFH